MLSNKLNFLKLELEILELESLLKQNSTETQLIGEIMTVKSTQRIIIFLSLMLGLLLSIVIILINNSLKPLKEEQV